MDTRRRDKVSARLVIKLLLFAGTFYFYKSGDVVEASKCGNLSDETSRYKIKCKIYITMF